MACTTYSMPAAGANWSPAIHSCVCVCVRESVRVREITKQLTQKQLKKAEVRQTNKCINLPKTNQKNIDCLHDSFHNYIEQTEVLYQNV